MRSLAYRLDMSRSLRSVRLVSALPRDVFQQPAKAALLLLSLLTPAGPLLASEWNIGVLMEQLAAAKPARVGYVETKRSEFLQIPLRSEGALEVTPEGGLIKEIRSPHQEVLRIRDEYLTIERPGEETISIHIAERPALRAFLAAFQATLRGDLAMLEHNYSLKLEGDRKRWVLNMVPLLSDLRAAVRLIRIEGTNDKLRAFAIDESGGDSTRIEIKEIH